METAVIQTFLVLQKFLINLLINENAFVGLRYLGDETGNPALKKPFSANSISGTM